MVPTAEKEAFKLLSNNTNKNWAKDKGLRKLNFGISFMFASSAASGYNSSLINGLLIVPEFITIIGDLDPTIIGLLIAGTSLGALIACIPSSYVADRLGRKICIEIGCVVAIIAGLIQMSVQNHWVFFSTRVMGGIGMGIAQTGAPSLATEIAHPRQRQTATGLYNASWCLGSISSAAVTFATLTMKGSWSWRLPCLLQIFYPLLQLIGVLWFTPESPRWLVSKNRKEEALAILAKYHANGDADDELVQHEFEQICSSISVDADLKKTGGWSSFISSRGNIHRLTICVLVGIMQEWAGNGIISYYLSPVLASVGITNAVDQSAVNVSIQVWNLLLSAAGAIATERYGRRTLWLISTVLMLLFLSLLTVVAGLFAAKHIVSAGVAVVPMLFLFFGAYDIAYAPLFFAYPAEILPFQLRAKGLAITMSVDALACFFNQYVNPVAFAALRWRYYTVYLGCLVLFLVAVYFLFPETKGRSLEEVSMIFEKRKEQEPEDVGNLQKH